MLLLAAGCVVPGVGRGGEARQWTEPWISVQATGIRPPASGAVAVRGPNGSVTAGTGDGAVDSAVALGLRAEIDAETSSRRIVLPEGLLQVEEQTETRFEGRARAGATSSRSADRTTTPPLAALS